MPFTNASTLELAGGAQAKAAGWWSRRLVRPCRVDHYGHARCGKKWCGAGSGETRTSRVNDAYFVMDWWFAARSAVVLSWHEIVRRWETYYLARARELYIAYEAHTLWSHFVWAMHVREVINMSHHVGFLPDRAFRTALARLAWPQVHTPRGCPMDLQFDVPALPGVAGGATVPMSIDPSLAVVAAKGGADGRTPHDDILSAWRASCPLPSGSSSPSASEPVCCGRADRARSYRTCGTAALRHAQSDAERQDAACAAGREALLPFAIAACEEPGAPDEPDDRSPAAPCHLAALARRRAKARTLARMAARRRRAAAADRRRNQSLTVRQRRQQRVKTR